MLREAKGRSAAPRAVQAVPRAMEAVSEPRESMAPPVLAKKKRKRKRPACESRMAQWARSQGMRAPGKARATPVAVKTM